MFDAHCHSDSPDSIVCSASLLPQNIELPVDYTQVGISEIGLDRRFVSRVPMEEQVRLLSALLEYAKEHSIPVSLHCVHATQLMVNVLKAVRPSAGYCLWHGFTGSAETASLLNQLGVLVSLGPRFKGLCTSVGEFVVETDYEGNSEEERLSVLSGLYEKFASQLGISAGQLEEKCHERARAFTTYSIDRKRKG